MSLVSVADGLTVGGVETGSVAELDSVDDADTKSVVGVAWAPEVDDVCGVHRALLEKSACPKQLGDQQKPAAECVLPMCPG